MVPETKCVSFKRRGQSGTLRLSGVIDIFEAASLLGTAVNILQEEKVTMLSIDCASLERMDLSAIQILTALHRDLCAGGRQIQFENMTSSLTTMLTELGLKWNMPAEKLAA